MAKPRQIEEGTTYLITRRCFQRRFLLAPSLLLWHVFVYCLAIAAERTGMLVHAACVLSNHYHLVITDVRGELPEFMRWLNEFVAKCINARYGRWESVWAPGSYNGVKIIERNDILAKIVYTLNNPVDAGLVPTGDEWPGVRSKPEDMLGTTWTAKRPEVYFKKDGGMPETASLTFSSPPSVDDAERFVGDTAGVLAFAEKNARAKMAAQGWRFLGRKAVLKQRYTDRPKTREPRRQLSPRIACRDTWQRIEAIQRLQAFYDDYRAAWLRFKQGARDVVFPQGTYWMVRYAGARCAGAG